MIGLQDTPLVMPMRVEALVVGESGGSPGWAEFRPKLENLASAVTTQDELVNPPLHHGQRPAEGVHLHFRLPPFFRHGHQKPDGTLQFRRVPNRWLVQRLWRDAAGQLQHMASLVRSDARSDGGHPWLFTTSDGLAKVVRYGSATEIKTVPEPESPDPSLRFTAVGQGDPSFAAHYPASGKMLGFHDCFEDKRFGPDCTGLSYVVTGFFSRPDEDPLQALSARDHDAFEDWLHGNALSLAEGGPARMVPRRLICAGAVSNVGWKGAGHHCPGPSFGTEDLVRGIAIGDSATGALAALLDDNGVVQDALEAIHDGLADRSMPIEALRDALHGRRFDAEAGGTEYRISRKATDPDAAGADDAAARADGEDDLPPALKAARDELNRRQRVRDTAGRRLADRQRRLYAASVLSGDPFAEGGEPGTLSTLRSEIGEDRSDLADAIEKLGEMVSFDDPPQGAEGAEGAGPRSFSGEIADALQAASGPGSEGDYELTETVAKPFFAPAEPSLAIEGAVVRQLDDAAEQGDRICRILVDGDGAKLNAAAVTLEDALGSVPRTLDSTHRIVLAETLPTLDADVEEPVTSRPGLNMWAGNPWIPVFLAWRVGLTDEKVPVAPGRFGEGWDIDAHGDLAETGPPPDALGVERDIEGVSLLSRTLVDTLAAEVRDAASRLGRSAGDNRLVSRLEGGAFSVQRMTGFDAALRGEYPALHMPPLVSSEDGQITVDEALCAELDWDTTSFPFRPAPDFPGAPIRAGRLRVDRLAVIDAFGQKIEILDAAASSPVTPPPVIAAQAARANDETDASGRTTIRPRLLQPARLRFAATQTEARGWVMANHFDKSVVLFDGAGHAVLGLQRRLGASGQEAGRYGFYPVPPPREGPQPEGPIERGLDESHDPHLAHFARWALHLDGDGADTLLGLIEETDETLEDREPDEASDVSALLGRPLALATAALRIELAGLPFKAPAKFSDPEPAAFQSVRWPVRIGDRGLANDGTVGLFVCSAEGTPDDKAPFCAVRGSRAARLARGGFAPQSLTVDARGDHAATHVLLLFDPRARVHAATGILPRQTLSGFSASGSREIGEAFFQTAPVIGRSASPALPRPSDDYGEWTWAWRPDVTRTVVDGIAEASVRAKQTDIHARIAEGWLKLALGLRIASFAAENPSEDTVSLSWEVRGAKSVVLEMRPADGGEMRTVSVGQSADKHIEAIPERTVIRLRAMAGSAVAIRELTVG